MSHTARIFRSLLGAAALALAVTAACPATPDALGASWEDVTCSLAGHVASTEGWSPRYLGTSSAGASETNTCATPGGALTASDQSRGELQTGGSGAEWTYTAPKGEPIAGGTVTFALTGAYGHAWLSMPEAVKGEEATVLAYCFYTVSCKQEGEVPITKHGADQLYAGAVCVANPETNECRQTGGLNAEVAVSSAKILLSDNSRPTAAEVTGSVLDAAASGNASLSFTAGDSEGPGVYGVVVKVDGNPVYDGTPDINGGKCVPVGTAPEGSRQFEATQPCPQAVPVSVQVPTSGFRNGQHTLTIEAEDAAGVNAQVYSAPITIANAAPPSASAPSAPAPAPGRGAPNGVPASEQATLTAAWLNKHGKPSGSPHLTSVYGRSQTVTGRLTDPAGAAIAGAAIEVSQTPTFIGASAAAVTVVRTAADGTFMLKLPAKMSSATINLAYRSHLGDQLPAATTTLSLSMPASVHMTVTPGVVNVGQIIHFHGVVAGPIPPGGKAVTIDARAVGGAWVQFETAMTEADGDFHATHKLKYPGPARYEFRAVCKHEADFAFSEGRSNIAHLREP